MAPGGGGQTPRESRLRGLCVQAPCSPRPGRLQRREQEARADVARRFVPEPLLCLGRSPPRGWARWSRAPVRTAHRRDRAVTLPVAGLRASVPSLPGHWDPAQPARVASPRPCVPPPPAPAAFPLWPSQVPALRPPHSDEQVRPPPCPALVVGLGLPPNGHLGPCPAVALSMRRQPLRDSLELHTTGKVTVWGHLFLGRKSLGSVSRPSFLDKAGLSTGPVSAAR